MAFLRSIATISSLTAVSRVLGFVRDILMTAFLGAGMVADCFVVAFKLPNFFRRLFAEGAFNAAFIPLFSGKLVAEDGEKAGAIRFAEDTLAVLLTALMAFVGLAVAFMPWVMLVLANGFTAQPEKFDLAVELTRITFPYLLFISLVSLLGGVLNALERFAAVASTPILLNVAIIAGLLGLRQVLPTTGHAMAIGVTAGGVLQFIWLVIALRRQGVRMRLRLPKITPGVRRLLLLMAPLALGVGALQLNLLIDILIASFLPEGSLAYLYYADRLNQLPIGVVGIAVGTAILPLLSKQVAAGDDNLAVDSLNRGIEVSLFFTLPAAVALIAVPDALIAALFERGAFASGDTAKTAGALAAYALGLPAYVLLKTLGPAYFARQDTKTPVRYGIIALVVNTVLNLVLMGPLAHIGLALATAIAAWLNVALLARGLLHKGQLRFDARLRSRLPRAAASAVVMGGAVWALAVPLSAWFGQGEVVRAGAVALIVITGVAVYGLCAHLTGALRLAEVRPLMRGQSSG